MVIKVEHARSVVEHISVNLAYGDNKLQDMSGWMLCGNAVCNEECERAPAKLYKLVDDELIRCQGVGYKDLQR